MWGAPTFSLFSIAVGDKEKGMGENTLSTYGNICVIIRSWLQQLLLLPFYSSCNHECILACARMNIECDVCAYFRVLKRVTAAALKPVFQVRNRSARLMRKSSNQAWHPGWMPIE
jgi:hypothetical protein